MYARNMYQTCPMYVRPQSSHTFNPTCPTPARYPQHADMLDLEPPERRMPEHRPGSSQVPPSISISPQRRGLHVAAPEQLLDTGAGGHGATAKRQPLRVLLQHLRRRPRGRAWIARIARGRAPQPQAKESERDFTPHFKSKAPLKPCPACGPGRSAASRLRALTGHGGNHNAAISARLNHRRVTGYASLKRACTRTTAHACPGTEDRGAIGRGVRSAGPALGRSDGDPGLGWRTLHRPRSRLWAHGRKRRLSREPSPRSKQDWH